MLKRTFILAILSLGMACGFAGSVPAQSIYPKVISPNGDSINDRVFFIYVNPTAAMARGTIYDSKLQKVAEVRESSAFVANSSVLTWDGKDDSGSTVPAGIYFYKIEIGSDVHTGSVGVVR